MLIICQQVYKLELEIRIVFLLLRVYQLNEK